MTDGTWTSFVDDAAIFPPGDAPLHEATATYGARTAADGADLVGTFVLRDTDLPLVRGFGGPLSVVVTGGAGQLAGPAGLCRRIGLQLAGLELTLQDRDDLAGNARRVVAAVRAAQDEGLDEDVPVYVELPAEEPTFGWLAAADEVVAAELGLKFRTGGTSADAFPTGAVLAGWIEEALDRETPFTCTAGLHRAVRHTGSDGFEHHGFLNILLATRHVFDGASREEAWDILDDRDPDSVRDLALSTDLHRTRRWFRSFGSCSVDEPLADLRAMGLL